MADKESRARRHPEPQGPGTARDEHELLRTEQKEVRRLTEVLRIADLMAILMVLATIFSAYATWRTAQVTSSVFLIADRPFLGVRQVQFEAVDSPNPMIAIDFRNFGQIPALDTLASAHAVVNGKMIKPNDGEMTSMDAGIVPPSVPFYLYAFLPADLYHEVLSGKSNLQVHVHLIYKGPRQQREYCYFERIVYDYRSSSFRMGGGNEHCGSEVF
jgi:hypothetical protein